MKIKSSSLMISIFLLSPVAFAKTLPEKTVIIAGEDAERIWNAIGRDMKNVLSGRKYADANFECEMTSSGHECEITGKAEVIPDLGQLGIPLIGQEAGYYPYFYGAPLKTPFVYSHDSRGLVYPYGVGSLLVHREDAEVLNTENLYCYERTGYGSAGDVGTDRGCYVKLPVSIK